MIKEIYLDLDGVCANFVQASINACGFGGTVSHDDIVTWDYYKDNFGISANQFWSDIDARGEAFWAGLNPYPWFNQLVDACIDAVGSENLFICTTPSQSPFSFSGKASWIDQMFDCLLYTSDAADE